MFCSSCSSLFVVRCSLLRFLYFLCRGEYRGNHKGNISGGARGLFEGHVWKTFRCKNQTRYSRQRTSAKNPTRFSSDFRVRLAANAATANAATANAATQPENIRECRHEAGRYNKERRGLKRKQLRRPLPICIRRTRPTSFD